MLAREKQNCWGWKEIMQSKLLAKAQSPGESDTGMHLSGV